MFGKTDINWIIKEVSKWILMIAFASNTEAITVSKKPTIFCCYEEMCVMRKYLIILVWVKREYEIQWFSIDNIFCLKWSWKQWLWPNPAVMKSLLRWTCRRDQWLKEVENSGGELWWSSPLCCCWTCVLSERCVCLSERWREGSMNKAGWVNYSENWFGMPRGKKRLAVCLYVCLYECVCLCVLV